jgi:hypothetical protein
VPASVGRHRNPDIEQLEMSMRATLILTAAALAAGLAAPANAGSRTIWVPQGYVSVETSEKPEYRKIRRYVPRQIEHDANSLPVGTTPWWQQMDREQRGGRR